MVRIQPDSDLFTIGRNPERLLVLCTRLVGKFDFQMMQESGLTNRQQACMQEPIGPVFLNMDDEVTADFVQDVQINRHVVY